MANTYYDSELSAEEIENALNAVDGIITPANNGKVLAISNGKIVARSVQWGGGEAVLEPLSVIANGDYYPESGVDGFDEVHVDVPNSYAAGDEGKVVKNGALIAQTAHATITANGTYDTTENNSVQVNVSGGGSTLITKNITQNGTYNASADNADGYSQVVVDVSGGGGNVVLTGSDIPTSAIGQNGDVYRQIIPIEQGINYVEYLESSGTQYIDTGIIGNNNLNVQCIYKILVSSGNVFGARQSSSSRQFGATIYSGSTYLNKYSGGTPDARNGLSVAIGDIVKMYSRNVNTGSNTTAVYFNDTLRGTQSSSAFTTPSSIVLFGTNQSGTKNLVANEIRRIAFFDGNNVIADYIPCLDVNGIPCMWENIAKEYAYNDGTGSFAYGTSTTPAELEPVYYVKNNGAWELIRQ